MKGEFKKIVENFPVWLDTLQKSPSFSREQLKNNPKIPEKGIYVFYDENDVPLYVGRSDRMRNRLLEHSRPSSGHNSATFAFILAKEKMKILEEINNRSRNDLQFEEKFSEKYLEAKNDVSKMKVRVIEINDATEQALFEIYVSLELNTPYNSWENH